MSADGVTFADRIDFWFHFSRFGNNALDGHSGPGGSVLLLRVVTLNDQGRIAVADGLCSGGSDLEEDIHSDGKVRTVEQRCTGFLHLPLDLFEVLIPAGGTDNHRFPAANAGLHVLEYGVGIGEIDDRLDIAEAIGSQRTAMLVVSRQENLHVVAALSCNLTDQRSSFAVAQ